MDKIIMAYTMLKKYKDLDNLIFDINQSINNKAINSYYIDACCGVQKVASCIFDLMEIKRILFNIKLVVSRAISKLSKQQQEVFELYFVKKIKAPAIAESLKLSKMQAYRLVQSMPKRILPYLEQSSYFDEFCNIDYYKINYIKSAYEHYSEKLSKQIV